MEKNRKITKIIISCWRIGMLFFLVTGYSYLSAGRGFLVTNEALANNVVVSSASLTEQSTSAQTAKVQFDIAWDNSWRDTVNYDAVWVFIKYSTDSGTTWSHATLKTNGTNPSGFSQGTGTALDIVVPTDLKGAFLQRSAEGTGSVDTDNIQFVWDWNTDGLSASDTVYLKIFAIEMVYIPQGILNLNTTASATLYNEFGNLASSLSQITSEDALAEDAIKWTEDFGAEDWYGGMGNSDALGASYPKGYAAFYCMKHEISQGQYTDFLNTLTRTQQNTRTYSDVSTDTITNVYVMSNTATESYRNTITCPGSGNGTTAPITFSVTRAQRACNFLTWMDLAAYADWSALRPMTELEFEKACRGDQSLVTDEYPWGTTNVTVATVISGTEDGTETITTAGANCCANNQTFTGGDGGQGPLRCGIFAKSSTAREQAGAGYYGVMNLAGNAREKCVTVADMDYLSTVTNAGQFNGSQGNGALDSNGDANTSTWPGTNAVGSCSRGSSWRTNVIFGCTSDRVYGGTGGTVHDNAEGGRCVRTP